MDAQRRVLYSSALAKRLRTYFGIGLFANRDNLPLVSASNSQRLLSRANKLDVTSENAGQVLQWLATFMMDRSELCRQPLTDVAVRGAEVGEKQPTGKRPIKLILDGDARLQALRSETFSSLGKIMGIDVAGIMDDPDMFRLHVGNTIPELNLSPKGADELLTSIGTVDFNPVHVIPDPKTISDAVTSYLTTTHA